MFYFKFLLFIFLLVGFVNSLYVQIIGNNYVYFFYVIDFQFGWEDLLEIGCEVCNIGQVLESDYNFIVQYYWEVEKVDIFQKIVEINSCKYGKNDQVFFFFFMYGYFDKVVDCGYFVLVDGKIFCFDVYG